MFPIIQIHTFLLNPSWEKEFEAPKNMIDPKIKIDEDVFYCNRMMLFAHYHDAIRRFICYFLGVLGVFFSVCST